MSKPSEVTREKMLEWMRMARTGVIDIQNCIDIPDAIYRLIEKQGEWERIINELNMAMDECGIEMGGTMEPVWKILRQIRDFDFGKEEKHEKQENLKSQVTRLANFIMAEVPGEPSQNQGAIDTAIRVLRRLREERSDLARKARFFLADTRIVNLRGRCFLESNWPNVYQFLLDIRDFGKESPDDQA